MFALKLIICFNIFDDGISYLRIMHTRSIKVPKYKTISNRLCEMHATYFSIHAYLQIKKKIREVLLKNFTLQINN